MRSLEKKGMLMKAVNLGIPWLMATLDAGGEIKNDAHSELAFAELRPEIRLHHQYHIWGILLASLRGCNSCSRV
jgi:hypothetical protein